MLNEGSPAVYPATRSRAPGLLRLIRQFGPGVISGAANDDPSCIVTYSIAGATFGYLTLWTSLFAMPLIAAVQLMCSRLGMVSGRGLAGAVRVNYSKWILFPLCALLAVANVIELGADLGGMADVTQMLTGISASFWILLYGITVAGLLFLLSYSRIQRIFKWLCLALFAYVAAGFLSRPDWRDVAWNTFVPQVRWSREYLSVLVAVLGATLSPYFLFWQASQEVEAEYSIGRRTVAERRGASAAELDRSRLDVFAGSFISKLITYFITMTTAATLFAAGQREIRTAKDAAAALQPLAGDGAFLLFAIGVIGTGMLAVPVLAGSCAYAWSEAMRWRASLEVKPRFAPNFYAVLFVAVVIGLTLIYTGLNVVQMLFWASIVNGLLAPVCILLVVLLTTNAKVMNGSPIRGWLRVFGWLSFAVTAVAAVAMIFTAAAD
ncbi:MAG TPA: divalent metal cation transporter [Bryobacteraceae bacterium]|nr:divalent metal cation transporter [Bryobacteraceae bacterium]